MTGYYTTIIFLSIFAMLTMIACVLSSNDLAKNKRILFLALFINSDYRVIYLSLAMTAIFLFVFYSEMVQQLDGLTGLINRHAYEICLSQQEDACAIIYFDVDKFKDINDTYSHTFGDGCLRTIGHQL